MLPVTGTDTSGEQKLTNINNGEWTALAGVDFGAGGATGIKASVLPKAGGQIKVRLDAADGAIVGTIDVPASTAGTWQNLTVTFAAPVTGVHSVFFTYEGTGSDELFDVDNWEFTRPADTTAPVVTAAVNPAAPTGSNGWYTGAVDVTATATDDSGQAPTVQVSLDGEKTWADYAPRHLTDGEYNLQFRAADAAGNMSAPVTQAVKVDTVVPMAAATVNAAARTVTIDGTDTGSGVGSIQYKVNGAADWTTVTGAQAVATVAAAAATVEYRAADTAGNLGAVQTVNVPAANGPQAAVTITSAGQPTVDGWYNQNVLVALSAPAGEVVQYRVDGGAWKTNQKSITISANGVHTIDHQGAWTTIPAGQPVVVSTVGDYVVTYRSTDAAGNVDKERSTTVSIAAVITPALTVNTAKPRPGDMLTFTVTGFDRYDTVTLKIGSTTLGTVFTDVKGAAKVTLQLPATTALGAATVTASGSDGDPTATAQVTVKR